MPKDENRWQLDYTGQWERNGLAKDESIVISVGAHVCCAASAGSSPTRGLGADLKTTSLAPTYEALDGRPGSVSAREGERLLLCPSLDGLDFPWLNDKIGDR